MDRRDALRLLGGALALAVHPARGGGASAATTVDDAWTDPARGRELPLRLRWPAGDEPCGLVVYSHGLGGSRAGGALWGEAWQAAGLAVLHVQHPGSDSSIWQQGGRRGALRRGASAQRYAERVADAHFVLDELLRRHAASGVWSRLRPDAIGFAGHSFGARLTQAVAGERPPRAGAAMAGRLADPRPRAFVALSPGLNESDGLDDATLRARFGAIHRPFLCVTGTNDGAAVVGDASQAARRAVYQGLPAGHKAELVLAGADHMSFGGGTGLPDGTRRLARRRRPSAAVAAEARHQRVVAAITADWWRWHLLGDAEAGARLRRPAGLAPDDLWQTG